MHCERRCSEESTFLAIFWGSLISQERLLSRNSTRKPLNLNEVTDFHKHPLSIRFLYYAPSLHAGDIKLFREGQSRKCAINRFSMNILMGLSGRVLGGHTNYRSSKWHYRQSKLTVCFKMIADRLKLFRN